MYDQKRKTSIPAAGFEPASPGLPDRMKARYPNHWTTSVLLVDSLFASVYGAPVTRYRKPALGEGTEVILEKVAFQV